MVVTSVVELTVGDDVASLKERKFPEPVPEAEIPIDADGLNSAPAS